MVFYDISDIYSIYDIVYEAYINTPISEIFERRKGMFIIKLMIFIPGIAFYIKHIGRLLASVDARSKRKEIIYVAKDIEN